MVRINSFPRVSAMCLRYLPIYSVCFLGFVIVGFGHPSIASGQETQPAGQTQEKDQPPQVAQITQDDGLGGLLDGLDLGPDSENITTIPDASDEPVPPSQPAAQSGAEDGTADSATGRLIAAFQSMQTARQLLSAGQTDETVLQAQQRAVDLLDQLIAAQQAADRQSTSQQDQTQQTQARQSNQQGERQQPTNMNQQTSAEPGGENEDGDPGDEPSEGDASGGAANENSNPSEPTDNVPVSAAGDASPLNASGQGVWGHLPQKTRGMLRADIPTDYLPGYSQQISDYFRALAEMSSDE